MERERRLWPRFWGVELLLFRRWEKAPDRVGAACDWLLPVLPLATAAYEERRLYMARVVWDAYRASDDVWSNRGEHCRRNSKHDAHPEMPVANYVLSSTQAQAEARRDGVQRGQDVVMRRSELWAGAVDETGG